MTDSVVSKKRKNANAQALFRQRRNIYLTRLEATVREMEIQMDILRSEAHNARSEVLQIRAVLSEREDKWLRLFHTRWGSRPQASEMPPIPDYGAIHDFPSYAVKRTVARSPPVAYQMPSLTDVPLNAQAEAYSTKLPIPTRADSSTRAVNQFQPDESSIYRVQSLDCSSHCPPIMSYPPSSSISSTSYGTVSPLFGSHPSPSTTEEAIHSPQDLGGNHGITDSPHYDLLGLHGRYSTVWSSHSSSMGIDTVAKIKAEAFGGGWKLRSAVQ